MLAMRQKLLDHEIKSVTDAIKTSSKRVIQKTAEATVGLIGNKIELQKFQKIHYKIFQRQLQMSMIKKYLKKYSYLQEKDKKLLMD